MTQFQVGLIFVFNLCSVHYLGGVVLLVADPPDTDSTTNTHPLSDVSDTMVNIVYLVFRCATMQIWLCMYANSVCPCKFRYLSMPYVCVHTICVLPCK